MAGRLLRVLRVLFAALVALAAARDAAAVNVLFDYRYAGGSFLDDPTVQGLLDTAAGQFAPLTDSLGRIDASEHQPLNSWDALFNDPSTGNPDSITDLVVPADTLVVFVGVRDLGGSLIGQASPGGASITFTADANGFAWRDLVDYRGQTGEPSNTDFGPWGGWMSFDDSASWNLTAGLPAAGEVDFLSTAVHELAHVFGFGGAGSWQAEVNGGSGTFDGATAQSVFGGPVPLADAAHWADSGISPEPAMDPDLTTGTRKLLTSLDYAGLADIGWEVPAALLPEPDTGLLLAFGLIALVGVQATRRRSRPLRAGGRPTPRPAAAPLRAPRRSRGFARARR